MHTNFIECTGSMHIYLALCKFKLSPYLNMNPYMELNSNNSKMFHSPTPTHPGANTNNAHINKYVPVSRGLRLEYAWSWPRHAFGDPPLVRWRAQTINDPNLRCFRVQNPINFKAYSKCCSKWRKILYRPCGGFQPYEKAALFSGLLRFELNTQFVWVWINFLISR